MGHCIGNALPEHDNGSEIVKNYICDALGFSTYDDWVKWKHPEVFYNIDFNIHDGRLQWIDWMINEYEKIGQ